MQDHGNEDEYVLWNEPGLSKLDGSFQVATKLSQADRYLDRRCQMFEQAKGPGLCVSVPQELVILLGHHLLWQTIKSAPISHQDNECACCHLHQIKPYQQAGIAREWGRGQDAPPSLTLIRWQAPYFRGVHEEIT